MQREFTIGITNQLIVADRRKGCMFLVTLKEKISHIIGEQDLPLAIVVKGIGDGHIWATDKRQRFSLEIVSVL